VTEPIADYIAEWRKRERDASAAPWGDRTYSGRDYADEECVDFRVTAGGEDVAVMYLTGVIESVTADEDAVFIQHARVGIPRLLAALERVLEVAAKHEHDALRWQDPLPVPPWIPELREAISAELLSKENSDV
jgi:hypothetical protein